jgi:hypothetical protein
MEVPRRPHIWACLAQRKRPTAHDIVDIFSTRRWSPAHLDEHNVFG